MWIVYTVHCINSDEPEIENAAGKTGQDIKGQVKFLGLFMKLLGYSKMQIGHNSIISGKL
jgi:hypothetical protein